MKFTLKVKTKPKKKVICDFLSFFVVQEDNNKFIIYNFWIVFIYN